MNRFTTAVAAVSFALTASFAFAQAPAGDGKGPGMMGRGEHHRMMKPCKDEPNPAKCETDRKAMRESMKAAHDMCKDKPDRRACMTEQYCAKSADPAKCRTMAKERGDKMRQHRDERQIAAEACTGKRGDELGKCMHEQREKSSRGRPDRKG